MARWAGREPAFARVVPRAERNRDGGGASVLRVEAQVLESGRMSGWSFEEVGPPGVEGRGRRVGAWMVLMVGWVRRVVSIWLPCRGA